MVSGIWNIGIVMTLSFVFLPFMILTPWANVEDIAILGHPHVVFIFWSIGSFGPESILMIELFAYYEVLAYLVLNLPNILFVYKLIQYTEQVASKKEVLIAALIGPIAFLMVGFPSTIFYYLSGYLVLNLPLPLLQIVGLSYLRYGVEGSE
ncbi:MAG: hypothetical protein ACFFED_03295 [Candidatus Thorarchaeota archaeon]